MLYASIIELGNSICRLLSNGEATGTRTLARMAMEAFVDLTNLMSDRTYVNNLQVRELREWQLTYERAAKGNPYFAGIAREPGFEERRETEARELETLRQQGFNRLSAEDRFRRAGKSEDYDGAYRWMSSDSHNSLRSLVQRHMNVVDEKNAELHILMELDLDRELSVLATVSDLLIGASKLVLRHFGNDVEFVTDLEQELVDIHQRATS